MNRCGSVVQGYGGQAARATCGLPSTGLDLRFMFMVALTLIVVGLVLRQGRTSVIGDAYCLALGLGTHIARRVRAEARRPRVLYLLAGAVFSVLLGVAIARYSA